MHAAPPCEAQPVPPARAATRRVEAAVPLRRGHRERVPGALNNLRSTGPLNPLGRYCSDAIARN